MNIIKDLFNQVASCCEKTRSTASPIRGAVNSAFSSKDILAFSTNPCSGFWVHVPLTAIDRAEFISEQVLGETEYPVVDLYLKVSDQTVSALSESLRATPAIKSCSCTDASTENTKAEAPALASSKAGESVTVCAGNRPPGWVIIDVRTDFTQCGGGWDNMWIIKNLNGMAVGSVVTCCASNPVPPGWVVIGTSTDFTRCGRNQSFNNLKTLRKVS